MTEYIDTTKGCLTAELWHVSAYVVMKFDDNFHASVSGEEGIRLLRQSLLGFGNQDGGLITCDDCNFRIGKDNNGLCILTYKGTARHSFSTSVTLTIAGHTRLIEILDAAIAQAFTPEEIAENESRHKKWKAKRRR